MVIKKNNTMRTKVILSFALLLLTCVTFAQGNSKFGIPLIGSAAPAFKAETTNGTLNFPGDFGYSWKILFSHPQDFTPVCTTEITELARLQERLASYDVKVAIISTDTKERHLLWKKSIEETLASKGQPTEIKFPLIDDSNVEVSKLYGMIHEPVSTTKDVRGVFIISPDNVIKCIFFYPTSVGRNMEEIVRSVQALQTVQASRLSTPVNWVSGGDLLVPVMYYPYTEADLASNPEIKKEFYQEGVLIWYKKNRKL
jgi:peroxiredoxin 2/4